MYYEIYLLASVFATFSIFLYKENNKEKDEVIILNPSKICEMRELMTVLVADSWSECNDMNEYNRNRVQEDIDVSECGGFIYLNSNGFTLRFKESDQTYYMSLHLGTSYRFVNAIWKNLLINFSKVDRSDGNFVKGFDFSNKKTATRYYENDYLIKDLF
jgi:hypothetical protein